MTVIKKTISVFEFGYLGEGEKAQASSRIEQISGQAFKYLKHLCLCDESESRFLRLKSIDNCEVLQVNNYVGVLLTPDGTQIEVLPKIAKKNQGENAAAQAQSSLLMMLKTLKQFRHLQTHSAYLAQAKMPLLEVFISQFLTAVNTLIKRGLRSDYVRREDNLAFLKGKLLVGKQLQHNSINKHHFYVEYDEYLQDRPINRLIHSALKKVHGYCRAATNQKLLQELLFVFAEIPLSSNIKNDFASIKLDRGMSYYQAPLAWARLILEDFSPLTMKGQSKAFSLLFPMESVFESFVASVLKKRLLPDFVLTTQANSESLVTHKTDKYFRLKPDLLIKHQDENHVVLDTKWKLIDQNKDNGTGKYDLSQADFYQMFAYGHKYLKGEGELFLIFPSHDEFEQPIEHCFDFSGLAKDSNEAGLTLWVVPFCVEFDVDDGARLKLPDKALSRFYCQLVD